MSGERAETLVMANHAVPSDHLFFSPSVKTSVLPLEVIHEPVHDGKQNQHGGVVATHLVIDFGPFD